MVSRKMAVKVLERRRRKEGRKELEICKKIKDSEQKDGSEGVAKKEGKEGAESGISKNAMTNYNAPEVSGKPENLEDKEEEESQIPKMQLKHDEEEVGCSSVKEKEQATGESVIHKMDKGNNPDLDSSCELVIDEGVCTSGKNGKSESFNLEEKSEVMEYIPENQELQEESAKADESSDIIPAEDIKFNNEDQDDEFDSNDDIPLT